MSVGQGGDDDIDMDNNMDSVGYPDSPSSRRSDPPTDHFSPDDDDMPEVPGAPSPPDDRPPPPYPPRNPPRTRGPHAKRVPRNGGGVATH